MLRNTLLTLAGTLLCLVILPLYVLADAPVAAWAIGAGLVFINAIAHAVVAHAVRDASISVSLGAMGFSLIFRAGITAMTFFFIGAAVGGASGDQTIGMDRPDLARAAIVVFLLGFTVDAAIDTLRRASQRDQLAAAQTTQETPA